MYFILFSCSAVLNPYAHHAPHYPGNGCRIHQRIEGSTEASQTVRVPRVRGQGERRRDPAQMSRVQGRAVLRQEPRHPAHARARELLRRADSDVRLPRMRGSSSYNVLGMRRGGVLLRQEAHAEAQSGARERLRGAVCVGVVLAPLLYRVRVYMVMLNIVNKPTRRYKVLFSLEQSKLRFCNLNFASAIQKYPYYNFINFHFHVFSRKRH